MTRAPELALALTGMLLATLVAVELTRPSGVVSAGDTTGIVAVPRLRLTTGASHRSAAETLNAAAVDMQHVDDWATEILARPLFAHNRRPPDEAVATQAAVPLPRLTGVAVSPTGRSAIFAGSAGGKPVVVSLGGKIGRYTVSAIEPGAVTVNGPDGARTLIPSFDAARQAVVAASAQVASQIAAAQAAAVAAASQAAAQIGGAAGQPTNQGPQPGNPQPGNPQPGNLLNSALGILPPLGRPRFISGHTPPPGFEQQAPNQANGPPPVAPQP